MSEMTLSRI